MGRFGGELVVHRKNDSRGSLVTDVDLASQKLIFDVITTEFPDHLIIGEEEPPEKAPRTTDFVWVVDPIDGTTNFVSGMPTWGISAAALYKGRPIAGACYIPWPTENRHLLLHARLGGGAWSGKKRLSVHRPTVDCIPEKGRIALVPGWFSRSKSTGNDFYGRLGETRTTGSVVYDLCLAACGISQYSLTGFASVWDYAAGILLISEAGGTIATLRSIHDRKSDPSWTKFRSFAEPYENSTKTYQQLRDWHGLIIGGEPNLVDFIAKNYRTPSVSLVTRLYKALFCNKR